MITIPGILAGKWRTTSRIASVPPVDAPMATKSKAELVGRDMVLPRAMEAVVLTPAEAAVD